MLHFSVKCYKGADHFWPLDKIVAGTVYDLIGSKHGKVNHGVMRSASGYEGMATLGLPLNSAGNRTVDFGDFSGDCVGDAAKCNRGITVGFWVMVIDDSDIFHTAMTATDRGLVIFYKKDTSSLIFRVYSTYEVGSVSLKIATLVWYHVFLSWTRGKDPLLIVNGADEFWGSHSSVSRLEEKYAHLLAGRHPEGGGSDGGLSQAVIYKRALDKKEMLAVFHCVGVQAGRFHGFALICLA